MNPKVPWLKLLGIAWAVDPIIDLIMDKRAGTRKTALRISRLTTGLILIWRG